MDKQEAKLLLQALRPAQLDASQPVIAEVLAMVEKDSELKAWWEAQQSFDLKVSAKLREIQVPDELRSMILAGRKIEQFRTQPHFSWWLAAAAAVAILCVAGTLRQVSLYGPLAKNDYAHAALTLLNHDHPELAMISSDHSILWDLQVLTTRYSAQTGRIRQYVDWRRPSLFCGQLVFLAPSYFTTSPGKAPQKSASAKYPETWPVDALQKLEMPSQAINVPVTPASR